MFYLDIRTSNVVCIVFGGWGCGQVCIAFTALTLPHHRWLEELLHEGVGWHGVVFSAHASNDFACLIAFPGDMMELESIEPS